MHWNGLLSILPALWVVSVGYTVNKGGLYGNYASEVISGIQSEVTDFLKTNNVSITEDPDLSNIWQNTVQALREVVTSDPSILQIHGTIPTEDDANRNATALVRNKGFIAEEHYVTTSDGFILFILRVKSPRATPRQSLPVFLLHGLLSSCDCYINNYRNESLAFLLAERGYDVWLGNIRGNRYTTKHVRLQPTDRSFWQWSFDEMGQYDVPVMVDYVLSKTGHHKLDFIGHSEGTTNLITSVIVHGEILAEKINKFVALAPAVYVGHARGLMRQLGKFAKAIQKFWDKFEDGDIFSHDGWLAKLAETFCYKISQSCSLVLHSMVGTGTSHFNMTRIPVYLSHAPAGTSTQNMVHWSQQCDENGNKLKYYDYGSAWENYKQYGQLHPPEYDLSKFTVPTYAFFGKQDWLVSPPDAEALISDLHSLKSAKFFSDYNHIDFVWGFNVANTLYRDVIDILET